MLNSGSGWESGTLEAVNKELGQEVRRCLVASVVGQKVLAGNGR